MEALDHVGCPRSAWHRLHKTFEARSPIPSLPLCFVPHLAFYTLYLPTSQSNREYLQEAVSVV